MELRTFRAGSMQEALQLVRKQLGADAAVLHTRVVRRGWRRLVGGGRLFEVTASRDVPVPSRLPKAAARPVAGPRTSIPRPRPGAGGIPANGVPAGGPGAGGIPAGTEPSPAAPSPESLQQQLQALQAMVEQLCQQRGGGSPQLPDALFEVYTDLIEHDLSEEIARELVERLRPAARTTQEPGELKQRLAELLEPEVRTRGGLPEGGPRKTIALVGPTGVGKTTTVAKLAANYHLREHRRVGLITVDTYRIAAVEQLRTYAEIIDLPMEVVTTPREMRAAVERMRELDLVLIDTAGRSPRDEIRIRELKALLQESQADEVHLVLSAVAGGSSLLRTAEKFAGVGVSALLLTKLDEAVGLAHILPLLQCSRLPVSYVTHGQNVPDDIEVADSQRLTRRLLGLEMTGC